MYVTNASWFSGRLLLPATAAAGGGPLLPSTVLSAFAACCSVTVPLAVTSNMLNIVVRSCLLSRGFVPATLVFSNCITMYCFGCVGLWYIRLCQHPLHAGCHGCQRATHCRHLEGYHVKSNMHFIFVITKTKGRNA